MGDDGSTTIGTYFNEDEREKLLAEFDERFDDRSAAVKDAMRLYLSIERALDETSYDFDHEQDKRMFVRQALFDLYRREQSGDV